MKSFFRNLESQRVRYLLISGQASVLYGGATFSEDVDLWISPTRQNLRRFLLALHRSCAVVHKLTPPMTLRNLKRGHGFHFRLPEEGTGISYLDVMGRPPRVKSFRMALSQSKVFHTDWGRIPVVGIADLVELKKTRRLADYDVISNLVRIRLLEEPKVTQALLQWALRSCFRTDLAQWILVRWPSAITVAARSRRAWIRAMAETRTDTVAAETTADLAIEIGTLQQRDVAYWSGIIQELRRMHGKGRLLVEGSTLG